MKYILLDTNIFLHCRMFDTLPWSTIIGSREPFTILIPMQVLREIEKQKDSGHASVKKRAKEISSKLGDLLLEGRECQVSVETCTQPDANNFRDGFSTENADDVILMSAIWHTRCCPKSLIVVSRDVPFLIKAKQEGLGFVKMSDEYLLPSNVVEDKEKQQMAEEIRKLKNKLPNPFVAFENGSNVLHLKRLLPKEPVIAENLTEEERNFCLLQEKALASKERFCEIAVHVFNKGSAPTDVFTVQMDLSKLKTCRISYEIVSAIVPERFQTEEEKNKKYDELENGEEDELIRHFSVFYKDNKKENRIKFKEEFESITQGLHLVIYYIEIDLFEATSGSIDWMINVPALPESVKGTLHIVVDK